MCHLATKCKEKPENNTLGTHLLSSPSHTDSHNELKQKDQVSGNRLAGKELLLHGQWGLEGGKLNSQANMFGGQKGCTPVKREAQGIGNASSPPAWWLFSRASVASGIRKNFFVSVSCCSWQGWSVVLLQLQESVQPQGRYSLQPCHIIPLPREGNRPDPGLAHTVNSKAFSLGCISFYSGPREAFLTQGLWNAAFSHPEVPISACSK